MGSEINRPTGYGFQGSMWRLCTRCGHPDGSHYGHDCHIRDCGCRSFCARENPEDVEPPSQEPVQYIGETLYVELKREASK